jgi:hypothetical protein
MARLLASPALRALAEEHFAHLGWERFQTVARKLGNAEEFQAAVISPLIDSLVSRMSDGLTISGLENLDRGKRYLFLSNHRDIVCDPALVTNELLKAGFRTPEICLGDNLLKNPTVTDLVKTNKGVTVRRGVTARELLRSSQELSAYIRESVTSGGENVWIAHREGRAKNGDDRTQSGVLRMLALSGKGSLAHRLAELRPVPVTVSYEIDPCDALKARELWLRETTGAYQKAPGEDDASMRLGIFGHKGRISIDIGAELTPFLSALDTRDTGPAARREQLDKVIRELDRQIHRQYHLWPSNHAALALLDGKTPSSDSCDAGTLEKFVQHVERQLDRLVAQTGLDGTGRAAVRERMLGAYAMPARNRFRPGLARTVSLEETETWSEVGRSL